MGDIFEIIISMVSEALPGGSVVEHVLPEYFAEYFNMKWY